MIGRPFSPEEDSVIIEYYSRETLGQIAIRLDRKRESVQQRSYGLIRRGFLRMEDRFWNRPWTERENDYLNDFWGTKRDKGIARYLNRTVKACILKAKRQGLNRQMNIYTSRNVARIFGVDSKTIVSWMNKDWIIGKKGFFRIGKHRVWNIDYESIEKFIMGNVWLYDWRRMETGYFSDLARKAYLADPWFTIPELFKELSWSKNRVSRWIHRGIIPFKWRTRQKGGCPKGCMVIRKADIPASLELIKTIVHKNRSDATKQRTCGLFALTRR